ncbi:hypothetical protein SESBI_14730 [Sesbania bispinosa]|nr:hypothetical protein SESBI_14730 [Sesbania bispinosa]
MEDKLCGQSQATQARLKRKLILRGKRSRHVNSTRMFQQSPHHHSQVIGHTNNEKESPTSHTYMYGTRKRFQNTSQVTPLLDITSVIGDNGNQMKGSCDTNAKLTQNYCTQPTNHLHERPRTRSLLSINSLGINLMEKFSERTDYVTNGAAGQDFDKDRSPVAHEKVHTPELSQPLKAGVHVIRESNVVNHQDQRGQDTQQVSDDEGNYNGI